MKKTLNKKIMKAQLLKRQDRWDLYLEDGSKVGSTAENPMNKLSLKNCEAIANGYDFEDLASQQTEWDVEIVTKDTGLGARINRKPKLDRDSCLILKRI